MFRCTRHRDVPRGRCFLRRPDAEDERFLHGAEEPSCGGPWSAISTWGFRRQSRLSCSQSDDVFQGRSCRGKNVGYVVMPVRRDLFRVSGAMLSAVGPHTSFIDAVVLRDCVISELFNFRVITLRL